MMIHYLRPKSQWMENNTELGGGGFEWLGD